MELLSNLLHGLQTALTLGNLGYAFLGAFLGTLIGVLPGLGPVATIAMLLPTVYTLEATPALIMLAGVYYGAQYGGSTTAILINMPGEASSVVTAIDGYQMARRGRAGPALAIAGLGSFFAGCVGTAVIAVFAQPLTELALRFGSAEYFALMLLGLIGAVLLASGSVLKALGMILVGLLLGQVNTDAITGMARFTGDIPELADGIGFTLVAMGFFGFGEIIANLGRGGVEREVFTREIKGLMPSREELRQATPAVLRGTALGSVLGILPGGGALLASFASYALEKRLAADPSRFGQGAVEGVAGPESANNAGAQTSFIPMLTLGIPSTAVMALMIGAMTVKGIQPGPQVMSSNPDLFWGLIASMWVGNLILLVLNLPLVGLWVRLLRVPYRLLVPVITVVCCIGVYSLNSSRFDVMLTAGFAAAGYLFARIGCEGAPLLLGFVLGPMMEEHLRRALLVARGDWLALASRPIVAVLLGLSLLLLLAVLLPGIRRQREQAFQAED